MQDRETRYVGKVEDPQGVYNFYWSSRLDVFYGDPYPTTRLGKLRWKLRSVRDRIGDALLVLRGKAEIGDGTFDYLDD